MDRYRRWFWFSLAGLTLFRLFFIGQFELSADEAYYWTWSRHLDWAYFDQGPLLALLIRGFTGLTGGSTVFSVRLGAIALSVLSAWVLFEWVALMFKATRPAWFAFLGLQSALLFSAGTLLMMHDTLLLAAWVLALAGYYAAVVEERTWGWVLGTLALGAGALAKYTMALFVPGLLLFLLLMPEARKWWFRPHLYLSGLGVLIMVLPMLFWNARHDWVTFGHIGQLSGLQSAPWAPWKTVGSFLGGQLGVLTPLLGVGCWMAPWLAWKAWKRQAEGSTNYLFLACASAPVLLFFFLLSFKTQVYANWAAPAYLAGLATLGAWCSERWSNPKVRNWTLAALALGMLMTLVAHAEAAWGILPLSGKAADSANRIRGWQQMGSEVASLTQGLKTQPKPWFYASRRYQIAALLSFYLPGQPEVQLLTGRDPMTSQYRIWDHRSELEGQDAIFVCEDAWEADLVRPQFQRWRPLGVITLTWQGRRLREVLVYQGEKLLPGAPVQP